ncbi:MAG TPA: deoxyribodipyrimidine photo-lyase [Terriglobales bacterium]|nr:deoxyribodipyrimidine photo-lyase [Terriglobales bacterium]
MATLATLSNRKPILLWFRRDLRLADNPALSAALAAAAAQGKPVIPVFILDESSAESRPLGGASRWWLGKSLTELDQALKQYGTRLILRRGTTLPILRQLIADTGAVELHFNRRFDPAGMTIDREVTTALAALGLSVVDHDGNYLHEPALLKTLQGQSFKVFTPFWRRLSDRYTPGFMEAAPRQWPTSTLSIASDPLASFQFARPWSKAFEDYWQPGEAGARHALGTFAEDVAEDYASTRDRPDLAGTSRLSPHLAWGEISVHRAWVGADADAENSGAENSGGVQSFRRELGWRDFNMHVLYHFHDLPKLAWQQPFRSFPFKRDKAGLKAWQRGLTGYPLVDAGMRELWHTGWMHNRVRMIVASFLIKHQLIDWRDGEAWFWDTLVDADPAQNAGNWQWVAGCGFDAAPFFRIFNPMLQGEKFDPKGDYIRRWVPELAKLKTRDLQAPWKLSAAQLAEADIVLGKDYPEPIVRHEAARARALTAYRQISGKGNDIQADLFAD